MSGSSRRPSGHEPTRQESEDADLEQFFTDSDHLASLRLTQAHIWRTCLNDIGTPRPDGRIRHWIFIAELGRYLRVVTLEDGETVHNAFPDRDFKEVKP